MIKIKVLQMDKLDKGLCDIFNLNFDTKQVSIIEKINVTNTRPFNYLEINLDNSTFVTMSHYPMLVWNKSHHGSINLFGHVHSLLHNIKYDEIMRCPSDNSYNVGVDVNNFEPCTLEEVIRNNEIWRDKLWKKNL